jgi:putative hemolysin
MQPDLNIIFFAFLGFLLLIDLLAVASLTSFSQSRLPRLLSLRDQQEAVVRRAVHLIHRLDVLQTSLHLTRLFSRFLAAGAILVLFSPSNWTLMIALQYMGILLLAALGLYFLEEAMLVWVTRHPEVWALRLSLFANLLLGVQSPVTSLVRLFKPTRQETLENMGTVTQDELISMLDAGHQEGVVEQDEREMIYSIFRLNDTLTREIMVPRIYITALDVNVSVAEAVDAMLAAGHSRIPVYEETIDNILGLVYAKDMLRAARDGSQINSLRSLLREVYFVPEAKKVDELLEEMQARRVQMAIVVDEYGGIAGLVTMEDIVEEIVGEIRDEYDQAEEMPYQEVSAGEYIFLGRIALDDFNSVMGTHLDPGEAETLSGFIYSELGRVPESGEQFVVDDLTLTVEQVSGRRIRKVRASRTQSHLPVDQEPEDARFDR